MTEQNEIRDYLSSSSTFLYKYVVPLCLLIASVFIWMPVLSKDGDAQKEILFAVLFQPIILISVWFFGFRLKEVFFLNGMLFVSTFSGREEIHPEEIERVTPSGIAPGIAFVDVHLKGNTRLGKKFRFTLGMIDIARPLVAQFNDPGGVSDVFNRIEDYRKKGQYSSPSN